MKNMKEITNDLMLAGATRRLEELNRESEVIKKLIEKLQPTSLKFTDFAKLPKTKNRKSDKKHWTQTPEGRKRMSQIQKERFKKG